MIISICRLVDSGKSVLSLGKLVAAITRPSDSHLRDDIEHQFRDLLVEAKPFKKYRDLTLAHLNLHTATEIDLEPLPGITHAMVEDVLNRMAKILNSIHDEMRIRA